MYGRPQALHTAIASARDTAWRSCKPKPPKTPTLNRRCGPGSARIGIALPMAIQTLTEAHTPSIELASLSVYSGSPVANWIKASRSSSDDSPPRWIDEATLRIRLLISAKYNHRSSGSLLGVPSLRKVQPQLERLSGAGTLCVKGKPCSQRSSTPHASANLSTSSGVLILTNASNMPSGAGGSTDGAPTSNLLQRSFSSSQISCGRPHMATGRPLMPTRPDERSTRPARSQSP